jgi:hypothetical protein
VTNISNIFLLDSNQSDTLTNPMFFFFTAQNILKFFTSRTSGTFGFARHTSRPFAKPKEPLFCQRTDLNINFETKENL